jgi:chloramphenicol-sensitive protein RarD
VDAVSGLTLESFWLIPVAVVQLIIVGQTTGITFGAVSTWHTALLLFAGVATAVPLLLFAAGARRINLTVIGMIQFVTPIMQFLTGVLILHEPMPPERWIGFIIVWIAVAVFVIDLLRATNATRSLAHRDQPEPPAP